MLATPRTPPNSTKTNPAYFESFLDEACRGRLRWQQQPERALMSGVNPVELLQYATGAMKDQERREAESMICRDPWAMGRVTALVKAARDTNSLAADLLRASRQTTNVRHILEKIKERITEVGWEEDPDLGLAYVIHSL